MNQNNPSAAFNKKVQCPQDVVLNLLNLYLFTCSTVTTNCKTLQKTKTKLGSYSQGPIGSSRQHCHSAYKLELLQRLIEVICHSGPMGEKLT